MWIRKRRRLLKNEFGSTLETRSEQAFGLKNIGLKSNNGFLTDSDTEEVRVFAMDEARFGLKTFSWRRWCPEGHRPPWTQKQKYQWLWLYAAVEPATGESFCLEMSHVDGECFETFLWEMKKAYPEDPIVLVFDRAGSHRSGKVQWPDRMAPLFLPPRSPELNPAERWFEELRRRLSNRVFESIEAIQEALEKALRPYWEDKALLQRLTGYGWWMEAVASSRH